MEFPARIRKQSESIIITIPNEVVKTMQLKNGEVCQFSVKTFKVDVNDVNEES